MKKHLLFRKPAIILIIATIIPFILANKSQTQTLIEDSSRVVLNQDTLLAKPLIIKSSSLTQQPLRSSFQIQSRSLIIAQFFGLEIQKNLVIIVIAGVVLIAIVLGANSLVWIGNGEVGIINKKFAFNLSRRLPPGRIIALNGEPGIQGKILEPGPHFGYPSWMYTITKVSVITINKDEIGLVYAQDGNPLEPGQNFGKDVKKKCDNFQDIKAFFDNGGQVGKQPAILTTATYRINTAMFTVKKVPVTNIEANEIGLVKARDGRPLKQGQDFGRSVICKYFQEAQAFFDNGGQAGKQIDILPPKTYQINTDLFEIRKVPIIRIPKGEIGLVIANEGASKPDEQTFGKVVECDQFQDASAFLKNGGQKGKQLAILADGIYRINTDFFTVITTANAHEHNENPEDLKVCKIREDQVGIVTTMVGQTLPDDEDENAGPVIKGHNNYQNLQKFLDLGGYKGLQEEVLKRGEWKLNPWFVKVEQVPVTIIEEEEVGVVISSVGKKYEKSDNNQPVSPDGEESPYQLVPEGYKGVQKDVLKPGKHSINKKVKKVKLVPTTQIILNWSNEDKHPLNYDANLKTLKLTSSGGRKFDLQFTQMISIIPENAPLMICKIGSQAAIENKIDLVNDSGEIVKKYPAIRNLVTRVLTKVVAGHFKGVATQMTAIHFQETINDRQDKARTYIEELLKEIGVQGRGTYINEVNLPEDLDKYKQELQEEEHKRKVEEEKRKTIDEKMLTEEKDQDFTRKQMQRRQIEAESAVTISELEGEAYLKKETAKAQAEQLHLETYRQRKYIDTSDKERISLIEVNAFKQRVAALSPELFAQIEIQGGWAESMAQMQITYPQIMMTGGGNSSSGDPRSNYYQLLQLEHLQILSNRYINPGTLTSSLPPTPTTHSLSTNQEATILSRHFTEPKIPVVLLLDTSSSMSGQGIHCLNDGITTFKQEFELNSSVSQSVELAIITCNSNGRIVQEFVDLDNFVPPLLKAEEETTMGKGLDSALDNLESHQHHCQSNNIQYHKPWLFLIIGSSPTDNWQDAVERVRQTVEANKLNFFVIAVKDADMISLRQVAPPNTPPIMLDGFKFRELFHWLADALKNVASSKVGSKLKLPPTTEWAQVNND